jgi:L-fucose mutarotase
MWSYHSPVTVLSPMLKNLPTLLSPDALHALASMGHGDELAIVDANWSPRSTA